MKTEGTPTGLANTLSLEKSGVMRKMRTIFIRKDSQGKHILRSQDLQDKKFLQYHMRMEIFIKHLKSEF